MVNEYITMRVVHAEPMTRQEYNDLRGWTLPHDENGDDEGMLVADGESGHKTWIPAEQFCKTYNPKLKTPESDILRFFAYEHLPGNLKKVSEPFALMAYQMVAMVPHCPERTAGLRKLLEAKDCAVRAAL